MQLIRRRLTATAVRVVVATCNFKSGDQRGARDTVVSVIQIDIIMLLRLISSFSNN